MARGSTEGLRCPAYPTGQRPQVGQDLTAVHAPLQEVTTAGLKASTARHPDTRPCRALPGQSLLECAVAAGGLGASQQEDPMAPLHGESLGAWAAILSPWLSWPWSAGTPRNEGPHPACWTRGGGWGSQACRGL